MATEIPARSRPDAGEEGPGIPQALLRSTALCALLFAFLTLAPAVLAVSVPQPPRSGGMAILEYISAHRIIYLAELLAWVGMCLPAIPVFAMLGLLLFRDRPVAASFGAGAGLLSEIVALAQGSSPPSLSGGLYGLAKLYAAADTAGKSTLATAAEALAANINAVGFAGPLTALGILALSIAMAGRRNWKPIMVLGVITGILGLILELLGAFIGAVYGIYGLLLPAWFVTVGLGLLAAARATRRGQ